MLTELLGIGANLIGGLMGSSAEKKANKQNYEIALKNYELEKEKFDKLFAEAQKQQAEGKLGATDAEGNSIKFVEGKGWVTTLGPESKFKQAMYNLEEAKQLGQDLPLRREEQFRGAGRTRTEGDYANALLEQLKHTRMEDPSAEVDMRNLASAEGINQGYDQALETSMRNAQRTGNSNAGLMADQIAKGRGDALRMAFMGNASGARDASEGRFRQKQAANANLYNTMATRASGKQPISYDPRALTGPQGAREGGQAANQNLLTAMGRPAPQMNYTHPAEMGMANTISQLGNNIFAGFGGASGAPGGGYGSTNYSNLFPAAPTGGSSNRDDYSPWA